MTTRNVVLLVVCLGGAGYALFNLEKFQGCLGSQQVFELEIGRGRPVACNHAWLDYVGGESGFVNVELDCGDSVQRASLAGPTAPVELCGYTLRLLESWQGGPTGDWNARIELSWEE